MNPNIEQEFNKTIQPLMANATDGSLGQPISTLLLSQVEEMLGFRFPEEYRLFLLTYGHAWWPETIYGVDTATVEECEIVVMTLSERQEVEVQMPLFLLPFSPDGWGNHFCFKQDEDGKPDSMVYFWSHELGNYQGTEYETFFDWLKNMIAERQDMD